MASFNRLPPDGAGIAPDFSQNSSHLIRLIRRGNFAEWMLWFWSFSLLVSPVVAGRRWHRSHRLSIQRIGMWFADWGILPCESCDSCGKFSLRVPPAAAGRRWSASRRLRTRWTGMDALLPSNFNFVRVWDGFYLFLWEKEKPFDSSWMAPLYQCGNPGVPFQLAFLLWFLGLPRTPLWSATVAAFWIKRPISLGRAVTSSLSSGRWRHRRRANRSPISAISRRTAQIGPRIYNFKRNGWWKLEGEKKWVEEGGGEERGKW